MFHLFAVLINGFSLFSLFSFLSVSVCFTRKPRKMGRKKIEIGCLLFLFYVFHFKEFGWYSDASWWRRVWAEANERYGCCKEEMGRSGIPIYLMKWKIFPLVNYCQWGAINLVLWNKISLPFSDSCIRITLFCFSKVNFKWWCYLSNLII